MNKKIKILIRYGDNDFWSTYQGILLTLGEAFGWNAPISDKEFLLDIINELAYGCYLTFQATKHPLMSKDEREVEKKHMIEYLNLASDRIYINEEVDEYLNSIEFDGNSENVVLEYDGDLPEDFKVSIY